MIKKFKKAGALMMVGAMAVSTATTTIPYNVLNVSADEEEDGQEESVTLSLAEMTMLNANNVEDEVVGENTKLTFGGQYTEIRYAIPEEYVGRVKGMTVNTTETVGAMAVKLLKGDGGYETTTEVKVDYNTNTVSAEESTTANVIGIMALEATSCTVTGITLELGEKKFEAEDKTFALEDLGEPILYDAVVNEGSFVISSQYGEVRYKVPEDIQNRVEGVVVNGDGNYGSMSVKMLTDDKKGNDSDELFEVAYGTNKVSKVNSELTPIKYIGIMSLSAEEVTFNVESITLKLNDGTQKILEIQHDIPNLYEEAQKKIGNDVKIGTCIPGSALADSARMELVTKHFNSVTCENEMKPDSILGGNPTLDDSELGIALDFSAGDAVADAILEYNEANGTDIKMRGHVLCWHSQTPAWFYYEDYDTTKELLSKEAMLKRQELYIKAVMDHYYNDESPYKDLIFAWDVVNEAISDGTNNVRTEGDAAGQSVSWYSIFSGDNSFICQAFVAANKYAPANVKLFYNDYNDTTPAKVQGICNLLTAIKGTSGARIDGMGMQAHYGMDSPSLAEIENAVRSYSAIVDEVQFTEIDFKATNGYTGATAEERAAEYTKEGYRYKNFFNKLCELNKEAGINITDIVFWGTDDGHSWLNDSNTVGGSGDGSPVCPLLFDREYQAKPAYWGIVDPDELEPYINEVLALQEPVTEIPFEDASATIIPSWDEDGLHVTVRVNDTTDDAEDKVDLYVDFTNDRTVEDDANIEHVTIARGDEDAAEELEDGGYEVTFDVENDELAIGDNILFDVKVTDGEQVFNYNDLKNDQANSKYFAKMTLKPFITIGKGTATVDGKAGDSIWREVEPVELLMAANSPEATATAKLLWDEDNLYVLMNVKDPTLDVSAKNNYEQDSVEIFIDEDNSKSDSLGDNDKQYRVSIDNVQSFNGGNCTADNITSAVTKTADGYILEAAIAWTSIGDDISVDDLIGFDVQINDGKGGKRIGTLNWYDTTGSGWSKSAVFGTARLGDEVEFEEDVEVEKVVNAITALGQADASDAYKDAVNKAIDAYDALTEDQQDAIEEYYYDIMDAALENYEAAVKVITDGVAEKINAIGTVTADSKEAIEAAREALDALTEMQKSCMDEKDLTALTKKLTDAETLLPVKVVEAAINALKDIKADDASDAAIKAAQAAYDALTKEQKALVDKSATDKLEKAQADYKAAVDKAKKPTTTPATTQAPATTPATTEKPATTEAPKTVTVSKVKSLKVKKSKSGKKTKLTITYKKVAGCKYQVQISTDKKFKKGVKKISVKANKTKVTYSKNFKGKKVYVRVRAYKKVNGKNVYGKWVTKKNIKTYK